MNFCSLCNKLQGDEPEHNEIDMDAESDEDEEDHDEAIMEGIFLSLVFLSFYSCFFVK